MVHCDRASVYSSPSHKTRARTRDNDCTCTYTFLRIHPYMYILYAYCTRNVRHRHGFWVSLGNRMGIHFRSIRFLFSFTFFFFRFHRGKRRVQRASRTRRRSTTTRMEEEGLSEGPHKQWGLNTRARALVFVLRTHACTRE